MFNFIFQSFKGAVDPKHESVQSLNQQANELVKDTSHEEAVIVKEQVADINKRWGALIEGIAERKVRASIL